MTMGYLFWYGYHVPAVRRRDIYYDKLEREKLAKFGGMALVLDPFLFLESWKVYCWHGLLFLSFLGWESFVWRMLLSVDGG